MAGKGRQGTARHGKAWKGEAGMDRRGKAGLGQERQARHGADRKGRQGWAWKGMAWIGKAKNLIKKENKMKRYVTYRGFMYDTKTGIFWHKDTEEKNWEEAKKYASKLNDFKVSWRVPSIEELTSIIDYNKHEPATGLKGIRPSYYWSSRTDVFSADFAWIVNFYDGSTYYAYKPNYYSVRCVSGQFKTVEEFKKTIKGE